MLRLDPDARRTPQHDPLVLARGCGEMFAAVITLAYGDLWAPDANAKQGRDQAYLLLTQQRGQWADHRTFLCDQCGVNGQKLRDFIWEQLQGVRDPIVRTGTVDKMNLQAGISIFTQAQIDDTRAFHQAQLARANNAARERDELLAARQAREDQERLELQARENQQRLEREARDQQRFEREAQEEQKRLERQARDAQQRVTEQQRTASSPLLDDWYANMAADA